MKKNELPVSFLDSMQKLLGEEYQEYFNSFEQEPLCGLRVNTAKLTAEELKELVPWELRPVPWISNGFYYEEEDRLSKDPYYYAGLYYLQEPSAMTPASRLPIEPGDMVLDLCAAPGGKSTELGARLQKKGMLVANDISNSRAKALLKNLELLGIENICVTSEAPEKLKTVFPEFFDKILVDAPCSGEGMFRKDPDMVKSWMEHGPEYYAGIQKEITSQAVEMLKPGGYLLYSTCTFARCEDEEVIEYLLNQYPELELQPLEQFDGASDGIGLHGCIRLFPHKLHGEGHFLALLHKRKRREQEMKRAEGKAEGKAAKLLEKEPGLAEFLQLVKKPLELSRIRVIQNGVYYLPEGFPEHARLRYLRTGLLLGELKKGRFEPGQALAMALTKEEFAATFSLPRQDDRVIRYLKGETIALHEGEEPVKGWCLVCVDGYPLGFAKGNGMTLKNKYYPGWRWQ